MISQILVKAIHFRINMLSKLWPFKKKTKRHISYCSAVIDITHKSGEKIKITVEGETPKIVAYMANKIKSNFNINDVDQKKMWEEADKMWEAADKVWKELDRYH